MNARYTRYTKKMLAQSVGARSRFNLARFQSGYFAHGGPGQIEGTERFARYYRVAEILDDSSADKVPSRADHHLACAYRFAAEFAAAGYVPPGYIPSVDGASVICEMLRALPETLRDRLDAVLEGLALGIDPEGRHEAAFVSWCAAWYSTLNGIYIATAGKPKRRLTMYRIAASEAFPDLLAWFDRIRHDVFDGGYDSNWDTGDEYLLLVEDMGASALTEIDPPYAQKPDPPVATERWAVLTV